MRCGARHFYVLADIDGERKTKKAIARTSAEARKAFRKRYGEKPHIISVREKQRES